MLGLFQAGAVLVPVNTRFKGAEAADILAPQRARVLVTVTDFLGTDYVAMLRGAGAELPDLETIVVARRRRRPTGTVAWDDFLGRADRRRPRPRSTAAPPRSAPTTRPTSSSPPGTTGVPKGVVHDPRPHAAGGHRLGGDDRPRPPATAT